jgi:hypothetical protein
LAVPVKAATTGEEPVEPMSSWPLLIAPPSTILPEEEIIIWLLVRAVAELVPPLATPTTPVTLAALPEMLPETMEPKMEVSQEGLL